MGANEQRTRARDGGGVLGLRGQSGASEGQARGLRQPALYWAGLGWRAGCVDGRLNGRWG